VVSRGNGFLLSLQILSDNSEISPPKSKAGRHKRKEIWLNKYSVSQISFNSRKDAVGVTTPLVINCTVQHQLDSVIEG